MLSCRLSEVPPYPWAFAFRPPELAPVPSRPCLRALHEPVDDSEARAEAPLSERNSDPLLLAPGDLTAIAGVFARNQQIELVGDAHGTCDFECRARL